MAGRREQRKAETRTALTEATRRLVGERGWDAVTVALIAREAGVGHRTFYRYFSGKEEAALAEVAELLDRYVDAVGDRPSDEHPVDSMLAAFAEGPDGATSSNGGNGSGDDGSAPTGDERWAEALGLAEEVPDVGAYLQLLTVRTQDRLTDELADRMGRDAADPQPRILAAAATAAQQTALRTWVRLPDDQRSLAEVWPLALEALQAYGEGLRSPLGEG